MHATSKIAIRPAHILAMPEAAAGELSDRVMRVCDFCGKEVDVTPLNHYSLESLAGPHGFHCLFCLQNGLHTKSNRNIPVLSFRSLIGYYYYEFYAAVHANSRKRMSYSQIEDYIESHRRVGLLNPVFRYDPDTFLWFVDFNRVGNSKRRLKVEEVHKTVVNVLACFNLWEVPKVQMSAFYAKYSEAVTSFYQRRYRPDDKRVLIPTLSSCGTVDSVKNGLFEKTRG